MAKWQPVETAPMYDFIWVKLANGIETVGQQDEAGWLIQNADLDLGNPEKYMAGVVSWQPLPEPQELVPNLLTDSQTK